jgi:hypothetical protein
MKKLVALILLLIVIFSLPKTLPFSIKEKIFTTMVGKIKGTLQVEGIEFNWFSDLTLKNLRWQDQNTEVKIPSLVIHTPLIPFLLKKGIDYHFVDATLYYKEKPLLNRVEGSLTLVYDQNKLTLVKPALVTSEVIEEGVEAFTNHILIPPFSSPLISLQLFSASLNTESKSSLKLQGELRLGSLRCKENHLLSVILNLLRQKVPKAITIECGKIPFIIENSIASFDKSPFLIDNTFEILSLGTINLLSDALNIHVGLTTSSLIRAFDLTFLPPGYMVPFMIKGTTHSPQIIVKEALKTIGILLLLEKIDPQHRVYPKTQSF